jgi:hypothetical protein
MTMSQEKTQLIYQNDTLCTVVLCVLSAATFTGLVLAVVQFWL